MSQRERELLIARYWSFYEGLPVPQWIEAFVGNDVLEIYAERNSTRRWFAHSWCIPCAIELEHRRESVTALRQLRRVAARVRTVGYDFRPAMRLSEDVTQEHWARYLESARCMSVWCADALRRQIEAMPATVQLRKELEAKKLPQGAAANLALMRAIVGLKKTCRTANRPVVLAHHRDASSNVRRLKTEAIAVTQRLRQLLSTTT